MKSVSTKTSSTKNSKKIKNFIPKKILKTEDLLPNKDKQQFLGKKQKRQRQENSLDELTRSFLKYVKETKTDILNINDIVKKLKVKKRRIYDITNVLEGKNLLFLFFFLGIGYIKKQAKNQVLWLKPKIYQNENEENNLNITENPIKKELDDLVNEDQKLQLFNTQIQSQIQKIQNSNDFNNYCFLTYNDIKTLTSNEQNNTILAIKTPEDVKMDILDDERRKQMLKDTKNKINENTRDTFQELFDCLSKQQQVYFSSDTGQIGVYLIMNNADKKKEIDKQFDPLCSGSQELSSLSKNKRNECSSSESKINNINSYFNDITDGLKI